MIFAFRGGSWDFADAHARVVGILNVTPDSFSDGGLYADPAHAIDRALELAAEGADAIDIGAQSTRPGSAAPVGAEEEWRRLKPVLAPLAARLAPLGIPISVDTYRASVARRGESSHSRVAAGTGQRASTPASGSRTIPLAKDEAA